MSVQASSTQICAVITFLHFVLGCAVLFMEISYLGLYICVLVIRISQDLAKDLAMLAREIHDVAGEIDSVSPAATDPGALVVKHHQILLKVSF